jgi:GTP-binding protein
VPKQDKIRWQQVMANYLVTRKNLMGIVLMFQQAWFSHQYSLTILTLLLPRTSSNRLFTFDEASKKSRIHAFERLTNRREAHQSGQLVKWRQSFVRHRLRTTL